MCRAILIVRLVYKFQVKKVNSDSAKQFGRKMGSVEIEAACVDFHTKPERRHEAEQILMQFKDSPNAIQDSIALLNHSTISFAQFHAISTIRELAVRKWTEMTIQEQEYMRELMINVCIQRFDSLETFVVAQLLRTAAILYKRGWVEDSMEKRLALVDKMTQMVQIDVKHQIIAAQLMFALVSEFSAGKSTALQMPLEFHARTKDSFHHTGLGQIAAASFSLLNDLIRSTSSCITINATTRIPTAPKDQLALLTICFELSVEILNWDFVPDDTTILSWNVSSGSSKTTGSSMIHPGVEWRNLLVQSDLTQCAFTMYKSIRQLIDSKTPYLSRQLLIQLASLSGKIFENEQSKVQYLGQMFQSALEILAHPLIDHSIDSYAFQDAATTELIDMCHLILRLVANLRLKLLVGTSNLSTVVQELSALSRKLLTSANSALVGHTVDVVDLWQMKGFDMLLEAWVILVTDALFETKASDPIVAEALVMLQQHCHPVVEQYIHVQLAIASIEALEEEEEDDQVDTEEELLEQLSSVASLARCSAASTIPMLSSALSELFSRLEQQVSCSNDCMTPGLSQVLEQMHFLIKFTGIILSDENQHEKPAIPMNIHQISLETTNASSDPIVELIRLVLKIFDFETSRLERNPDSSALSPYLAEQLLSTITRLAETYFAPSPEVNPVVADTIRQAFDISSLDPERSVEGKNLVDFLIKRCSMILSKWPTEPSVSNAVCKFLMTLSHNGTAEAAIHLSSWQLLVQTNASSECFLLSRAAGSNVLSNALCRLPFELRGQLTQAICRTGMAASDETVRQHHFEQVAKPIEHRLHQLMSAPSFQTNSPLVQETLKLLLAMYTGVVAASECKSYRMIHQFCQPVLPVMVQLMDMFHGHSQIVELILQFFCALTESQLTYLPPPDALFVYTACGEIMKLYSKHNLGRRSTAVQVVEEENFQDVLKMLDLLSFLIAKDSIDFADQDSTSSTVAVYDVVFYGLSLMIPLMTERLLKYPNLCLHFFNVVSYMIENYASKLAGIDSNLFSMLMKTLVFGLGHIELTVVRHSLSALTDLIAFHVKASTRGNDLGLKMQLQQNPGLIYHFLETLLNELLFCEIYRMELQTAYAEALLVLILADTKAYAELVEKIASRDPSTKYRLVKLCQELIYKSDGQMFRLDRFSRREFTAKVKNFLVQARGFLIFK